MLGVQKRNANENSAECVKEKLLATYVPSALDHLDLKPHFP